ncbi:MAG TPA: hypothetical protein VKY85_14505 [Candidatus Angelobacter sp.]|nr:hypothetical protein [Candidatus Angelobacter sp.]
MSRTGDYCPPVGGFCNWFGKSFAYMRIPGSVNHGFRNVAAGIAPDLDADVGCCLQAEPSSPLRNQPERRGRSTHGG